MHMEVTALVCGCFVDSATLAFEGLQQARDKLGLVLFNIDLPECLLLHNVCIPAWLEEASVEVHRLFWIVLKHWLLQRVGHG